MRPVSPLSPLWVPLAMPPARLPERVRHARDLCTARTLVRELPTESRAERTAEQLPLLDSVMGLSAGRALLEVMVLSPPVDSIRQSAAVLANGSSSHRNRNPRQPESSPSRCRSTRRNPDRCVSRATLRLKSDLQHLAASKCCGWSMG